jgi:hypothetical protein
MHDETLAPKELGRIRININRESKENLGLRTLFKKTAKVKHEKESEYLFATP